MFLFQNGKIGFSREIKNPWARGILFTIFGLASLVAEIILIYHEISIDDFLWLNSTDGTREYEPATSIFFLVFWLFGTILFFVAAINNFKEALNRNPKTFRPPRKRKNPDFGKGLAFFIIGLLAAVIPVVCYLDSDVNYHATLSDYILSIICYVFAIPFLVLGTIWMKPIRK